MIALEGDDALICAGNQIGLFQRGQIAAHG